MSGLIWRALATPPQSSVKSSCKVGKASGRWLGQISIDCQSHFHVTVMEKDLVKPSFKGWEQWERCKIEIQTWLPFCSTSKPVFPLDQQIRENVPLSQVHSHWTALELICIPVLKDVPAFPPASRTELSTLFTRRRTGLFQVRGCCGKTKALEWPLWMVQTSHQGQGG